MGGIRLAFDWRLLGLDTACAQAASFAATTPFEAAIARVPSTNLLPCGAADWIKSIFQ